MLALEERTTSSSVYQMFFVGQDPMFKGLDSYSSFYLGQKHQSDAPPTDHLKVSISLHSI